MSDRKIALVTGGSRGIGRAIAAALLETGVDVMIGGRSEASLREASAALAVSASKGAARLETCTADVRDAAQVAALVEATVARLGGLDILVNNAGVGIMVEIADLTPEQWREMMDTNLSGVFYGCHAAIPHLRRRGGGWIINISSLAGKNSFVGGAAYCATKAGLNAFSEALMQELRYDDIRVTYVMPGSVQTAFGGQAGAAGSDWKLAPGDVARVVVDLIAHDRRSLPSRVEIRPAKPRKTT